MYDPRSVLRRRVSSLVPWANLHADRGASPCVGSSGMSASHRIAYICSDPGIAPDGSHAGAVRFRSMARGMAAAGAQLDVFMCRDGDLSGFLPHTTVVVPTPRAPAMAGELRQLGHVGALLDALQARPAHAAVYERLSRFPGAGLAHARSLDVPYLVEVNAPIWHPAFASRSLRFSQTSRAMCLDVLTAADLVLAVSGALADELIADGVPAHRITVQGNGADVDAFIRTKPALRPASLQNRKTMVFVGSLHPSRGIDFLVKAVPLLRRQIDVGLWIVGDGPLAPMARMAAQESGDTIVYSSGVDHAEVPAILQAADVVVVPYPSTASAFASPLKLAEAIASRRPMLASRTACVTSTLAELRMPQTFAGLFAADDEADFVAAALRALRSPEDVRVGATHGALLDWRHKAREILQLLNVSNLTGDDLMTQD